MQAKKVRNVDAVYGVLDQCPCLICVVRVSLGRVDEGNTGATGETPVGPVVSAPTGETPVGPVERPYEFCLDPEDFRTDEFTGLRKFLVL